MRWRKGVMAWLSVEVMTRLLSRNKADCLDAWIEKNSDRLLITPGFIIHTRASGLAR
jgi:hypothetical protein